ncbi:MAG: peptidoglycan DD-metalloendopeptidase family protein [Caulobacterales bacterium]|nr:peptidoglycan DD-metalloendopeptidase family protein [Caulobacterales bacterium]
MALVAAPSGAEDGLNSGGVAATGFSAPAARESDPPYAGLLAAAHAGGTTKTDRLRRGEALPDLFRRAGVARADAALAANALTEVFDARGLRAGLAVEMFLRTRDGATDIAGYALSPETARTIHVSRIHDGSYVARDLRTPLDRRLSRAKGVVTESLYADAKSAGAHAKTIAEIADLMAYTVDFQREIMPGDAFEILFEEWVDERGAIVKPGDLYFVRFTPSGQELSFWRFDADGDVGYYDLKGESAKRFLMRTPVNGARLSSHFGRRRHPVLGYTRMHKGTDFAAPRGTPIYAAGDGVIERADRYGSFGNYVRIRHAHGYKTAYAHLQGFHRRARAGRRVKQGQIIGYVGTTGRSTGPHLHYEVHRDGEAINPLRVKGPSGRTLSEPERAAFDVQRAYLDLLREQTPLARPAEPLRLAKR